MAKKSRKQYFNELAREFAYSGPVLCRISFIQYAYLSGSGLVGPTVKYVALLQGEQVVVFRGPLPAGEHRKGVASASWLVYSFKYGPAFIRNTRWDFDDMFNRV